MKRIFGLFAASIASMLAIVSPVSATVPECEDCKVYRKGVHRAVVPTTDVVCIYFTQTQPGKVLLRLDLKDGGTRYYDRKNAGREGRICVGRHWVRASKSMEVCNEFARFEYEGPQTELVAEKPAYAEDPVACLHGRARCKQMGFPTRGD